MRGRSLRVAASNEGAFFRDDTGHRVKGVQRLQHTFRAPIALISGYCTGVVGGARDANGFDMKRGWVTLYRAP